MFSTLASARDMLGAHLDGSRLDAAAAGLIPAIVFRPDAAGADRIGRTRLGGEPDLPRGAGWPRPPAPADAEAIAARGSEGAAKEMREHLALGLPYAFIAQIDLAEAAALGPTAGVLPAEGRLLFFYDILIGCYDNGARSCRVLWDRTPTSALAPCAVPQDLAAAAEESREFMRQLKARYNLDAAAVELQGTNYGTRSRPLKLAVELTFPDASSDEGQVFWQQYDAVPYPGDDDVWRRTKLLGSPDPEQKDPRWDAAIVTDYGVQHIASDRWTEVQADIASKARGWRLLLQVNLADWMQADNTEGTIYFLIRHEDLAQRRFERVVTVYQQT